MLTYIRALLTLVAKKLNSMCAHGSKYIGYMKKKQGQSFENLPILGFFCLFFLFFFTIIRIYSNKILEKK